MGYVNIRAVGSDLKDRFKIEMQLHEIIRNSAEALKKLGVFAVGKKFIVDHISNFKIKVQHVHDVRAVILLEPPLIRPKIFLQDIFFPPQIVFEVSDDDPPPHQTFHFKHNYVPQIKGPYIDFEWDCPELKFNVDKFQVGILATGIKSDDEGYPMVPEEAVEVCSYYCAYIYHLPIFTLGKLQPVVWQEIKELKERAFAQARWTANWKAMNQNELDHLFNIMSSMDRKRHSISV